MAERPPVAPPALARRGARRARDPGRRHRDRRDDPRDREGARRRARSRRRRRSRSGPTTTPARCSTRAAVAAARLLEAVLADPSPAFAPQSADGVTYADKIGAGRPRARPRAARRGARPPGAGAVAAHRRARRDPRPPRHGLAGRRGGGRAPSSRSRCSPTAASAWTLPPGCAACADDRAAISPARAAAFDVVRRVFEDEAYADRALRTAAAGARRPRPGARPSARLRDGATGADARPRDRGDRAPARRDGSTRRCVPRSGSAPSSSRSSTACLGTRPSTSRSSSCAARGSSAPSRSRTPCCDASPTRAERSSRRSRRRPGRRPPLAHSYPDWVARDLVARSRRPTAPAR